MNQIREALGETGLCDRCHKPLLANRIPVVTRVTLSTQNVGDMVHGALGAHHHFHGAPGGLAIGIAIGMVPDADSPILIKEVRLCGPCGAGALACLEALPDEEAV